MRLAALVLGVAVAGSWSHASAQPASRNKAAADAVYAEGQTSYRAGNYLEAAARFESAYALDPDPAYLFNIAQAYRLGDACAKAAAAYRRFLEAVPNPPNLAKVQDYVAQAERCAADQATRASEPVSTPPANPVTAPVEPPHETPPVTSRSGRTQRWLGIGSIVVGAAALGAGVYFTREVGGYEDDRARLCVPDQGLCMWSPALSEEERRLEDLASTASRNAVLSYAVGGAAILGGLALYLLAPSGERASAVTVVPTVDGAVAVGAFRF